MTLPTPTPLEVAHAEIDRLVRAYANALGTITSLQSDLQRTRDALKECADDLAERIAADYKSTTGYPTQRHRYNRDMEIVHYARAILTPPTGT